jgi:hypothetical protein
MHTGGVHGGRAYGRRKQFQRGESWTDRQARDHTDGDVGAAWRVTAPAVSGDMDVNSSCSESDGAAQSLSNSVLLMLDCCHAGATEYRRRIGPGDS